MIAAYPMIPSLTSGLEVEQDSVLQMSSVWHSREQMIPWGLDCTGHWTAFLFPEVYVTNQDSFMAILDHSSVTLLFILSPSLCSCWITVTFLATCWTSHFTTKQKIMSGGISESAPLSTWRGLWWHMVTSGCLTSTLHWWAELNRHLMINASRYDCVLFALTDQDKS